MRAHTLRLLVVTLITSAVPHDLVAQAVLMTRERPFGEFAPAGQSGFEADMPPVTRMPLHCQVRSLRFRTARGREFFSDVVQVTTQERETFIGGLLTMEIAPYGDPQRLAGASLSEGGRLSLLGRLQPDTSRWPIPVGALRVGPQKWRVFHATEDSLRDGRHPDGIFRRVESWLLDGNRAERGRQTATLLLNSMFIRGAVAQVRVGDSLHAILAGHAPAESGTSALQLVTMRASGAITVDTAPLRTPGFMNESQTRAAVDGEQLYVGTFFWPRGTTFSPHIVRYDFRAKAWATITSGVEFPMVPSQVVLLASNGRLAMAWTGSRVNRPGGANDSLWVSTFHAATNRWTHTFVMRMSTAYINAAMLADGRVAMLVSRTLPFRRLLLVVVESGTVAVRELADYSLPMIPRVVRQANDSVAVWFLGPQKNDPTRVHLRRVTLPPQCIR
jgi:hypothetical protein